MWYTLAIPGDSVVTNAESVVTTRDLLAFPIN
jgi:hypothetical protein